MGEAGSDSYARCPAPVCRCCAVGHKDAERKPLMGKEQPPAVHPETPPHGWTGRRGTHGKPTFSHGLYLTPLLGVFALLCIFGLLCLVPSFTAPRQTLPPPLAIARNTTTESPPPLTAATDDAALFARALSAGNRPGSGTPKVALMFLTRGPLPLAPLWARFLAGHEGRFSIYIHTNGDYAYGPDELPQVFRGRRIPSKTTAWGSITLVDAERRLLAQAYMDPSNKHFLLLSETCIPLHPFPTLYQYLERTAVSFVQAQRVAEDTACWTDSLLPTVAFEDWQKGSQWFHLRREHVPMVLEDVEYYHAFGSNDLKTAYADEHFLPTLLHKKVPAEIANRSLTWFHFPATPSEAVFGRPWVFHEEVLDWSLLRKLRWGRRCSQAPVYGSPCYLFARKFGSDTLPKLMKMVWILGY